MLATISTSWLELPAIGIGQLPFAFLVAAVESPVFFGDGVDDRALPVLDPRVEDVDERLKGRTNPEPVGKPDFSIFSLRIVGWDTTI